MYVTRPLSLLKRSPELLSLAPQSQEGPNSGYLVLFDEECKTTCFGLYKDRSIMAMPFPQNKNLTVSFTSNGEDSSTNYDDVLFIPVLNRPLSSNRYYVIRLQGKHKGYVLHIFFLLLFILIHKVIKNSINFLSNQRSNMRTKELL